jgi:hypothetical protein
MKKINLILLGLAFLGFSACEKENTEGLSRVTNYPLFDVSGSSTVYVEEGGSFTEPGVVATENGEEIEVTTTASGAYRGGNILDLNKADRYNLTYKATNADGFDGSASRTVWVYKTGDLTSSIEGLYTSTIVRNGQLRFSNLENVLIWKNDDGTYELSCGFGAYYEIGTNYGLGYKSGGAVITANDIATNDFSFTPFSNDGFGGACEMTSMTVDAANKTVSFVVEWSFGYTFEVELTQVEL